MFGLNDLAGRAAAAAAATLVATVLAACSLTPAWGATPAPIALGTPTAVQGAEQAAVAPAAAPGFGSVTGNVVVADSLNAQAPSTPVVGATVTAYTIDAAGTATAVKSVLSGRSGDYTFGALPAATYYLKFEKIPASFRVPSQWYQQTALAPHGESTTVASQSNIAEYTARLTVPIGFTGAVTCELCTGPPDPAATSIELWVRDYDQLVRVQTVRPSPDGRYSFAPIFRAANEYSVRVVSNGAPPFAKVSPSSYLTDATGPTYTLDVIEARTLPAVPGVDNGFARALSAIYADFLHRTPTSADIAFWNASTQGYVARAAHAISGSDEARLVRIDAAYLSILNRASDAGGRLNWLNAIKGGALRIDDLETALYGSEEYFQSHGGTNSAYVAALYTVLLHRSGTAADYAFWSQQIVQHGRSWVAQQYWNTPEATTVRVKTIYLALTGRVLSGDDLSKQLTELARYGDEGFRSDIAGSSDYLGHTSLRYQVA